MVDYGPLIGGDGLADGLPDKLKIKRTGALVVDRALIPPRSAVPKAKGTGIWALNQREAQRLLTGGTLPGFLGAPIDASYFRFLAMKALFLLRPKNSDPLRIELR